MRGLQTSGKVKIPTDELAISAPAPEAVRTIRPGAFTGCVVIMKMIKGINFRSLESPFYAVITDIRGVCYAAFATPNLGLTWAVLTFVIGLTCLMLKKCHDLISS